MKMNVERSRLLASFLLAGLVTGCSQGAGIPFAGQAPGSGPVVVPDTITHHGVRAKTLYVSDAFAPGFLMSFTATTKSGKPATTLSGSGTGLSDPYFIAVGKSNRTWATNCAQGNTDTSGGSVVSFLPKATGNATPAVTITGSATTLSKCLNGIAVDSKGNVYVSDQTNNALDVFAAGANGNVAPARRITGSSTGLVAPAGIAVGPTGLIHVVNSCVGSATHCKGSLVVFSATANGNVKPTTTISGSATLFDLPQGVALDSAGNIYVTNNNTSTVVEFPSTAKGNAKPTRYWGGGKTRLAFPTGIAVDAAGYIYVGNTNTFYATNWPVLVFAPTTSTGKLQTAPEATIAPSVAGSNEPSGIAIFPPVN